MNNLFIIITIVYIFTICVLSSALLYSGHKNNNLQKENEVLKIQLMILSNEHSTPESRRDKGEKVKKDRKGIIKCNKICLIEEKNDK